MKADTIMKYLNCNKHHWVKHLYLILPCIVFSLVSVLGQSNLSFKYHEGTTPPDVGWNMPGFNDSGWLNGNGSIGYGDDDDTIIINSTSSSVYIRYQLNATSYDLNNLKALIIYADFDDGYIAYLNGKEVLRVNMDANLLTPSNTDLTIRSNEAEFYRNVSMPVQGYYINANLLDSCGFGTSNTLAFEVHNDSINGSDLSFSFDYRFYNDGFRYNYFNYYSRFIQQLPLDSTNIPIIVIETGEYGFNFEEGRSAKMGIINNISGNYNKLSDNYTDYDGFISIKGRGNRSSDYPKVSYRIELQDSTGNNNNVSLLGMPEENDFILYGPYSDESLIHNEIAFNLGRWLGDYVPRTRFCELIINGKDVGFYILTETIKVDKSRVDIAKLTEDDNSDIDVTGGYIFGYDGGWEFKIMYPSPDDISFEQSNYMNGFLGKLDSVLYSDQFLDPYIGYKRYLDIESLADFLIINECVKNREAYIQSTYMYKDRDDKGGLIQYGPLWDFDNSLGYAIYGDIPSSYWRFEDDEVTTLDLARILQDTSFTHLLEERWNMYRQNILSNDSIFNYISGLVDTLRPSIDRNYEIWPIKGLADYGNHPNNKGITYDEEITKLKNWLNARLTWVDSNIDDIFYPVDIYSGVSEFNGKTNIAYCYPNPFTDYVTLMLNLEMPGTIRMEVYDVSGKKLKVADYQANNTGQSEFRIDMTDIVDPGIYLISISKDNVPVANQRIVKVK